MGSCNRNNQKAADSHRNSSAPSKYFKGKTSPHRGFTPIKAFENKPTFLSATKTLDMRPAPTKAAVQPHQKGAQSACKKYPPGITSKLPLLEQLHIRIKEKVAHLEAASKTRRSVHHSKGESIGTRATTNAAGTKHVIIHSPSVAKEFHLTASLNLVNGVLSTTNGHTRNPEPPNVLSVKGVVQKPSARGKVAF